MRPDHGDVTAEYLALRGGTGYVVGYSEMIWVTGPETVSFLDGQLSQDLDAMESGDTARSLVLAPRGKLVAVVWALRGEDRVGLVCDHGTGTTVAEHLERFRFRVDAVIDPEPVPTVEVWGVGSGDPRPAAGVDELQGWRSTSTGVAALLSGRVLRRVVLTGVDVPSGDVVPCGRVATDTVRIESGEPVMGIDLDEGTIPQESGLVDEAVSFTKGCFVGQELVARIDSRGRVNRRLMGLEVTTNLVPPVGAVVRSGDDEVGSITTVGESLEHRAPVAMGMIKRGVEPGDDVTLHWGDASVTARTVDLPLEG